MSPGSYNPNLGSEILILGGDIRSRSWPNIGDSYCNKIIDSANLFISFKVRYGLRKRNNNGGGRMAGHHNPKRRKEKLNVVVGAGGDGTVDIFYFGHQRMTGARFLR